MALGTMARRWRGKAAPRWNRLSDKPLTRLSDAVNRRAAAVAPYEFWYGRYPHTFLERHPPETTPAAEVPKVVWVLWTGTNPMTPNRERSMVKLRAIDVPVRLVTPGDLSDLVLPEYPLHQAYENLSMVHRSDYLRCYLLHHYGGGYSDIKPPSSHSWAAVFDRLHSEDLDLVGAPQYSSRVVASIQGRLGSNLRRYFDLLVGTGMMVARAHTQLTAEWMREVDRRMDYYAEALTESPGNTLGDNPGYPVPWTNLLADVLHPLCLKYYGRVGQDARLAWQRVEYR